MSNAMPPGPWPGTIALDEGTLVLTGTPTPGPAGLVAEGGLLEAADVRSGELPPFEWKRLGFKLPPRSVISEGGWL